jgi:hypothetical protein
LKSPQNKYAKFFLRISTLLLIAVLSDLLIGNLLRHFYFKQVSGLFYRTTYAMDSTTADILVFGSSRANHHYVPDIFESSLKMSFYNTGRDGNYLLFNYAVFKAVVKRYSPKIILFDVNPEELYYDVKSYDRLSSLAPYYSVHPEIQDIVNLRGPFEKYKQLSAIYPFNSYVVTIGIGNLELNKKRKGDIKGYVPLKYCMHDTTLKAMAIPSGSIDNNKVSAVKDIMHYCKANNISLIFIQSPIFARVLQTNTSRLINRLVKENKAIFYSYFNDPFFFANPGYFQDDVHLNEKGAVYFSKMVVNRILNENISVSELSLTSILH